MTCGMCRENRQGQYGCMVGDPKGKSGGEFWVCFDCQNYAAEIAAPYKEAK